MKIHKQWLQYSLASIISIVFLVSVFNYKIDSLSIYGTSNYLSDATQSLVNGKMIAGLKNYDERVFQKLVINNLQVKNDVIVIGSSRSMKVRKHFISNQKMNFFNHSVSGASLEDYIAIIGIYEKTHGYIPSTVIFGIDPWIFNKNSGLSRWKSLENYYDFEMGKVHRKKEKANFWTLNTVKWKQLFNYDYTIANIQFYKSVILENEKIFYVTNTIDINDSIKLPDGSTVDPYSERSPEDDKVEQLAKAYTQGSVFALNNYYAMDNVELFENFISYLQSKGINVIFFLPPYHPTTYDILGNDKKYSHIIIAEKYLKKFAIRHHIKLYGSFNPHTFGFINKDFLDGMHGRENVAKKSFEPNSMYNIVLSGEKVTIEH